MTTSQRVEAILEHSSAARNSDKELWLIFAQKFGVGLSEEQMRKIRDMPEFETMRRMRQKIQEKGLYKADPKVQKERAHKAMVMQQTSPKFTAEQLERTLGIKVLPWGQ